jgi:signal transduction histidine kinase
VAILGAAGLAPACAMRSMRPNPNFGRRHGYCCSSHRADPEARLAQSAREEKPMGKTRSASTGRRKPSEAGHPDRLGPPPRENPKFATDRSPTSPKTSDETEDHGPIDEREMKVLVDILTHDIVNFQHVIRGYLRLLLDDRAGALDHWHKTYLERCEKEVERTVTLTENARAFIQLGDPSAQRFFEIDLRDLIVRTATEVKSRNPSRDVAVSIGGAWGSKIRATVLLRSAFRNLMQNALQHNESDVVEIGISIEPERSGPFWRIAVEDNGTGIPAGRRKTIFERFASTGQPRGSGLGLAIVKAAVELHGGRVWVEDRVAGQPSAGSRFVVLLPRNHSADVRRDAR